MHALASVDVSDTAIYTEDRWREPFAELRRDAPVAWHKDSPYGPYWSVSSHDLIQRVEGLPQIFSSSHAVGGITIGDNIESSDRDFPNFIAMDGDKHKAQRGVVAPSFSPSEIVRLEGIVRNRTRELIAALPRGETFDWVESVSIPLTIGMLCILMDFPWEERQDLKRWSDWASDVNPDRSEERYQAFLEQMGQMLARFDTLLEEKRAQPKSDNLLSRVIHSDAMGNMEPMERIANIALLIVAGNDTTRNSMSGFVEACSLYPEARAALKANPDLIVNAAQETIRWQSPVTHMRRTALSDTELGGQAIKKGEKVVMWYISGNRDESVFDDSETFDVTRENARRHVGFGYGVHRCVGARLAELQLDAMIREIVTQDLQIEITGPIERMSSCFLHGFTHMSVQIS